MTFFKAFYIHQRFYVYIALVSVCFLLSFWLPILYSLAWILFTIIGVLTLVDVLLLFRNQKGIEAQRLLPEKFSNSDVNEVPVSLLNHYVFKVGIQVIDELPVQFQKRDFNYNTFLKASQKYQFSYWVRPVERGEYYFGNLNVYASTPLRLIKKRYRFENLQLVKVYPSFIQMQKYDFLAFSKNLTAQGVKKIRRIGHTQEFEQIKEYVKGDDFRTINWNATAKRGHLMANQYQDEKSQPIYCIIDTGRVMKMPFKELKLLDYAINATLAFSNVALKKHDKVGMFTFSNTISNLLPAQNKLTYLNKILQTLYNINTTFNDSDFGLLYTQIKRHITHRSLLLLYTNFEHLSALQRQLPYLKAIAKRHLLVVIIFENTELEVLITAKSRDIQTIYHKTIAEKFAFEKRLMVKALQNHGIQTILTAPEQLTINTINKYLEIKSRGLL